ncbi:MAG: hypothetical protein ACREC9_04460 [Methylocella sp.]
MDNDMLFAIASGAGRAAIAALRPSGSATRLQNPELLARGDGLPAKTDRRGGSRRIFCAKSFRAFASANDRSPAENVSRETFLEEF